MKLLVEQVLDLQLQWSSRASEPMMRRGQIINHKIPDWLLPMVQDLRSRVRIDDLAVDSSDGAGAKARVPWVRMHSESRSPGASEGWYLVFLFAADGTALYLSLNQGSTKWSHGNFAKPRSVTELQERAEWVRNRLQGHLAGRPDLQMAIELSVSGFELGRRYEAGNVAAFRYPREAVPDSATIARDVRFLSSALAQLYSLEEKAIGLPGDAPPEIEDAANAAEEQSRPQRKHRRRLTRAESLAIERRAIHVATEYLRANGFTDIRDVGSNESYDIRARRQEKVFYVEVKGTTSVGLRVVLTANEVDLHRVKYPATMLIVVSHVELDRQSTSPAARGGIPRALSPWLPVDQRLSPIAYYYDLPLERSAGTGDPHS